MTIELSPYLKLILVVEMLYDRDEAKFLMMFKEFNQYLKS